MSLVVLLVGGLLGATTDDGPKAADLAAYDAAKAQTGPGAGAQVKLALWCEAHGLDAERVKHLALAVLADPKNTTARGLLGLVSYRGRWDRPDRVADKVKADEKLAAALAEYNARRDAARDTAESQWQLALWCEAQGLDAEAKAHLETVVRLDPTRDAAWKKLGCKKVGGRWVSETQLAAEKVEADAQKAADRKWRPLFAKWRGWLTGKEASKRRAAEEALAGVTDPRAVPAAWAALATGGPELQSRAVELFGRIDAAGSSRSLALIAVFGETPDVRRAAAETLRRRDPREFAGLLVAMLRDPIKYEVKPVGGPGSPGGLFVAGKRANVQRVYAPPAMPFIPVGPNDQVDLDANGLPVITRRGVPVTTTNQFGGGASDYGNMMTLEQFARFNPSDPVLASAAERYRANAPALWRDFLLSHPNNARLRAANPAAADRVQGVNIAQLTITTTQDVVQIPVGRMAVEYQKAALSAQQQLEQDVAALDAENSRVRALNGRVASVLNGVAGKDLGEGREPWQAWWVDVQGYAYTPKSEPTRPTVVENVPPAYTPQSGALAYRQVLGEARFTSFVPSSSMPSCFGAGTLVRTFDGARPIESVKVGDRVLTMDMATGALGYHPVTFVHHNPPSPTFLVKVKGDTVVSSPFHRFWVAGKGWVMARDLKGGETLRLLGGPARVDSVSEGPVQPVFNLDVDADHDFFAGAAAALVHDNTLPDTRLAPFDAPPALASK